MNPDHGGIDAYKHDIEGCYSKGPANIYGKRIPWEIPVQLGMGDFLQKGDCAIDVGANIGGLSIAMSRIVGDRGEVHAFEANPYLISCLNRDLVANSARNVVVVEAAVWSKSNEIIPFHIDDSFYASASSTKHRKESWETIEVRSIALDDYVLSKALSPRLIKIDVESAEYDVLAGSSWVARELRPVFVLEYSCLVDETEDPIIALTSHNYSVFDLNLYRPVDREFYISKFKHPPLVNVIAVPQEIPNPFESISPTLLLEYDYSDPPQVTDEIKLGSQGRYLIDTQLSGSDSQLATLKIVTTDGENLAEYTAEMSHLRQHSCSNLIIAIDRPENIRCILIGERNDRTLGIERLAIYLLRPEKVGRS